MTQTEKTDREKEAECKAIMQKALEAIDALGFRVELASNDSIEIDDLYFCEGRGPW